MNIYDNDDDGVNLEAVFVHLETESDYEKIGRLEKELDEAKKAALGNWEALTLLAKACKAHGFDPFAGDSRPLGILPEHMNREALIVRNQEASKRISKTRHASSEDAISQKDGFDTQVKIADEFVEDPFIKLLSDAAHVSFLERRPYPITLEEYLDGQAKQS